MRNQQPEMTPHPTQQPTSGDLQWQQHLMYKQLQELQKQQQLDHGVRQPNFPSQAAAKHADVSQLPALLSRMPINDVSRYMMPNDVVGGESNTPGNPQMSLAGNMNWVQGMGTPLLQGSNMFMFSNDHGQAMQSMGQVSHQIDQSLYGTPISSSRGLSDQYLQLQSGHVTDVLTRSGVNQLEKTLLQTTSSNSFHNDQRVTVQACLQDGLSMTAQSSQGKSLSGNVTSENFQQVNHPRLNVRIQDVHSMDGQADWSADLEEKAATVVAPSHVVTSLDPTEEKILFGSDDGNWSTSLSTGGLLLGNPPETNDQFNPFPSIQSGSWSALMQEAVQASSSDQGIQEEWSGLSFQKTEPSFLNYSAVSKDIGKHQAAWNSNNNDNLQGASSATLRAFPLYNDAAAGSSSSTDHRFQHSVRITYQQDDRTDNDVSHESFQQSSMDVHDMPFSQSLKQKKFVDGGLQAQMQHNDVPNDVWSRHMYEQSVKTADSAGLEFNSLNNQNIWAHQHNVPFSSAASQTSAIPDGLNKLLVNSGCSSIEVHGNNGRVPDAQNQLKRTSHINQDRNNHELNRHQVDFMKHLAFNSFLHSRGENVENYQQQPRREQHAQDSIRNEIDHSPSISDSQTSSGLSGWVSVGSRRSQYQQNVNSGMSLQTVDPEKDTSYSRDLSESVIPDSQNQGYSGHSRLAGLGGSDVVKGHSNELKRNIDGPEEMQHCSTMRKQETLLSATFDESSAAFPQNTKFCQMRSSIWWPTSVPCEKHETASSSLCGVTSQNMLELLHQVDQSRDNSTFPGFGNSNHSTLHGTYRSAGSDFHRQHHQASAFQGVGLRLTPPPQQSDRSLNPAHESSQREIQDSSANLSGEAYKEVLHSLTQENLAGFNHLKSSSEQPPMAETGPLLQASAASSMTRQIGFSMLQNVWTNASLQQRISCFQPPNLNSNVPQSTILASTCRDSASVLKEDDQGRKGESLPSELASCSNKSKQIVYGEDNPFRFNSLRQTPSENDDVRGCALEGQEQVSKHHSEGNSSVPISSMELLPRREANKAKHGQESFFNTQSESVSMANMVSPKSNIKHGCSIPSDFQQTNYSLLQQMQAMKRAGFDPSNIDGKRLKSDFNSDVSQGYFYGPNADNIVPSDGKLCTVSHNSFSHDVEMLSFSSSEHEEKFAGGTCQLVDRDVPSQDLYTSVHHDNEIPPQALSSTSNCVRRNGHPQISPQMAPSWFEHYRKYKNGQILAMHADQRNARAAPKQCFSAEIAERMGTNPSAEQRIENSQFSSPSHSTSPSPKAANKFSPHLPLDMTDHDTIMRPKKRKLAALEILPWHEEVVAGLQIPQSISSTEHEWVRSANRLTEKVEDEAELKEDGRLLPRARRRLILTTQLMQKLLPPVPAPILDAEVTSTYEHVTYFLAKSVLGRASSMISCSGSHSREHLDSGNRMLDKVQKAREFFFSKVVEDFIGRSRKLESDMLRLDKGTSVIDLSLECQDLERFSLVNRLGKFHGQTPAHGVESSSSSQSATRKLLPHKYVNGIPVPGSLPEGVICFSL